MQVITLINQKGGAGKSTLARGLLSAAEARGLKTGFLDTDKTENLAQWAGRAAAAGNWDDAIAGFKTLNAEEARDIGLVDLVVPHDELRAKTMELAEKIASMSPLTVRVGKEALRASERMAIEEGILYERDLFCLCFSTEDKAEGVDAFLNKRAAEWKGR